MSFPRLLLIVTALLLSRCGEDSPRQRADQRFERFFCYPSHLTALRCIAPYEEYCVAFSYPQHQRNREWIERIRHHAANRLLNLYHDYQLNHPQLRYLFRYRKRKVLRSGNRLEVRFYHQKDSTCIALSETRFSPSGYLLPCLPSFLSTAPH